VILALALLWRHAAAAQSCVEKNKRTRRCYQKPSHLHHKYSNCWFDDRRLEECADGGIVCEAEAVPAIRGSRDTSNSPDRGPGEQEGHE
jgi:hypothetical protein